MGYRKSIDVVQSELSVLASLEENRFCFDCGQRGPTYVNISIGSFVCTKCGGALRNFSQRIKSISMSNFSENDLEFLKKRGNKTCRKIYMALCDDATPKEHFGDWEEYLRLKYEVRQWYSKPSSEIEMEALRENQKALDRASGSELKKSGSRSNVMAMTGQNRIQHIHSLPSMPPPPNTSVKTTEQFPLNTHFTSPSQELTANLKSFASRYPLAPSLSSSDISKDSSFDPFEELIASRPTLQSSSSVQFNPFNLTKPTVPTSSCQSVTQNSATHCSASPWGANIELLNLFTPKSSLLPTFLSATQLAAPSPTSLAKSSPIPGAIAILHDDVATNETLASPAAVDKYAALAELDVLRKTSKKLSSQTSSFSGELSLPANLHHDLNDFSSIGSTQFTANSLTTQQSNAEQQLNSFTFTSLQTSRASSCNPFLSSSTNPFFSGPSIPSQPSVSRVSGMGMSHVSSANSSNFGFGISNPFVNAS